MPLRKIGELTKDDPRHPDQIAEVVFGESVYQMSPLGMSDLTDLIRALSKGRDRISKVFKDAKDAGKSPELAARDVVESGILKHVVTSVFGVSEEEYERTTLGNLLNAAGEVLRLNFFVVSPTSANAFRNLLKVFNEMGPGDSMRLQEALEEVKKLKGGVS